MATKTLNPQPRKRRVWPWLVGLGVLLWAVVSVGSCAMAGFAAMLTANGRQASWGWGDAVGMIYVEGTIGATGGVNAAEVIDFIHQAEDNPSIKAIVVYINSPGGSPVPSAEMYRALREATKPVVAVMGDVAASGGYYIAAGADKILAHPATITGSIGVYGQLINAAKLFEKLGVEGIIIRSGDSKAVGNWFERPTGEQLAIEQAMVDEMHAMFVRDVAEGRGMSEDKVWPLADGRAFTGQQALDLGLIDALGNLDDAIAEAATLGSIDGEPQIIEYYRQPSMLELWLASRQQSDPLLEQWLDHQLTLPQMLYLGQ
ncbi:MAG: signal peptide peptidase SppA [Anaerolineae bacterium]|nr:signal peptide peptidase SppA [Anaerolineae bacterium]